VNLTFINATFLEFFHSFVKL